MCPSNTARLRMGLNELWYFELSRCVELAGDVAAVRALVGQVSDSPTMALEGLNEEGVASHSDAAVAALRANADRIKGPWPPRDAAQAAAGVARAAGAAPGAATAALHVVVRDEDGVR